MLRFQLIGSTKVDVVYGYNLKENMRASKLGALMNRRVLLEVNPSFQVCLSV